MINLDKIISLLDEELSSAAIKELLSAEDVEIEVLEDVDEPEAYITFKETGFILHFENEVLGSIFFSHNANDGDVYYKGVLPNDIKFGQTYADVCHSLGQPSLISNSHFYFIGKNIPAWIRYDYERYSIHLQFNKNNSLTLVTLMSKRTTDAINESLKHNDCE